MEVVSKIKKTLFGSRCSVELSARAAIHPWQASHLLHALLTDPWMHQMLHSEKLKNVKGRDKENLLLDSPNTPPPLEQELVFVQGFLRDPRKIVGISLLTPFLRFEGSSIFHALKEHRILGTLPCLRSDLLGYVAPFHLTAFRIGIDRYESVFKAFSFGSFPEVTESITLDYVAPELVVVLSGQRLGSAEAFPFQEQGFGERLISLLKSIS